MNSGFLALKISHTICSFKMYYTIYFFYHTTLNCYKNARDKYVCIQINIYKSMFNCNINILYNYSTTHH